MARKDKHISILQFDERVMTRLRVKRESKGLEVLAWNQEQGHWPQEEGALAEALKAFVEKHAIAEDDVYTILPHHELTTRFVLLPSHDPAEIKGMVRLNAEEYVPYSLEELHIDQAILDKRPNGESLVLIALAHKNLVDGHLEAVRSAGIEPQHMLLSTACLASAAQAAAPAGDTASAIVNLASRGLEIIVLKNGHLRYGRGVATAQDWSLQGAAGEEALEELSVEVRASLSTYRRESEEGEPVESVYLCSEWADVNPAVESLTHETGKEVAPADFARDLIAAGQDHVPNLPLVSLGAALTAQGRATVVIDLVPESVTQGRRLETLQARVLRMAAVIAVVLAALGLLYGQAVWQRQGYIQELEQRVKAVEPAAQGLAAKRQRLSILRRQVTRSGSVLEVLSKVAEAAPDGVVNMTRFAYDRETGADLWGRAKSIDDVAGFAQAIREQATSQLELFAHAHSQYEQATYERNERVYAYQIEIPIPEETDEEEPDTLLE